MKKLLLLVLVLSMGGCHTCYTEPEPTEPEDSHIIYDSDSYTTQNTTEQWITGEWMQISGVAPIGFSPYVKFSSDGVKGQWVKFVNSISSPVDIIESSYKVEEDFWGTGFHRLISRLYEDPYQDNMLLHIEIIKLSENKMVVYHRGFNINNIPEGTEILDPKDAVRTFGNNIYAEYQRIER